MLRLKSRDAVLLGEGDELTAMLPRQLVKLAMLVGLYAGWLSWQTVWFAVFAGFLLGCCWGVPKAIRTRNLHYRFAFGPFLLVGALLVVLLH